MFVTGETVKKRCVEDLQMCKENMEPYTKSEKQKFELESDRFKIYRRCDHQDSYIVNEA